jgi:hypothetical protein
MEDGRWSSLDYFDSQLGMVYQIEQSGGIVQITLISWCLTWFAFLQDEKIELCRFSKDGTKPFLFCTVQKGHNLKFEV